MNKTKLSILKFLIITFFVFCQLNAHALKDVKVAEWSFFVYAQTKNDLNNFFAKNLRDMAKVGSSDKLNVVVQWEQPKKIGTWRYKVQKGSIDLDYHTSALTGKNIAKDVIDFFKWGVAKYPAKHYALILSGHGSGPIDPSYFANRGILFDWENRTYLNNQQLVEMLDGIKRDVLGGKKLELLGLDACLMASLETDYQIKDRVEYLVASQEQEHADGWFFSEIFKDLNSKSLNASQLGYLIVDAYKRFYEKRFDWYTQSAVNISEIEILKNNLNQILIGIQNCKKLYGNSFTNVIRSARNNCAQFNVPIYVDLHSFYSELYNQLKAGKKSPSEINDGFVNYVISNEFLNNSKDVENRENLVFKDLTETPTNCLDLTSTTSSDKVELQVQDNTMSLLDEISSSIVSSEDELTLLAESSDINFKSGEIENLKNDLWVGMKAIEKIVIANTVGKNIARAKGISIYFPKSSNVDNSYMKTEFAKNTLWVQFLVDNMR
ncbi:TPA: hypothetical protein DEO28_00040 [Candidatus Dependentiae bacterium]|nr:MAG: Peptidase C11 clostripain [candidate division TM6 bacterium GW2011_GWE2_31_21]KKP53987.1 MAG: Peptidase C11 clostripain [candidate division TM6 bacterium GW2011_GWF2_33_332]HBS48432.1 hypothetical protein [Candidatus Dependentiae bacterium]HBZ72894.1 hypothetical protein [Candidatus Dependentiae bacterium]